MNDSNLQEPWDHAANVKQWSHVETTEKSAIQEKKIRVVYLQPGDATNGTVAAGEVSVRVFFFFFMT
jgi:predicted Zn-dependent protease